jgi:hypothetical protein
MKHARPWYRTQTNCCYVCCNGKQENVGQHPATANKPRKNKDGHWNAPKEIRDAYPKRMGEDEQPLPRANRMKHVIDGWLADHKTLASYAWFTTLLNDFQATHGKLRVARFKRAHVRKWAGRRSWSNSTHNNAIGCIQTALNYAVETELIPVNPIRGMKKPRKARRERLPTPQEKKKILASITGNFKRYFYALISLPRQQSNWLFAVFTDLCASTATFYSCTCV